MTSPVLRALCQGALAGLLAAGSGLSAAACGPETALVPSDNYSLTFRVCDNSLVGTVVARATGWVAFGFSRTVSMPGSDVFMAGVQSDGTAYGVDAFAELRAPPAADDSQDVTLIDATELSGVTSYSFSRLLSTGDPRDYDLTDGSYYILWAFNQTNDSLNSRHTDAGASDFPYQFAPIPEAPTALLGLAGLGLLAARLRRRAGLPAAA
jgi:hypothetical protein